ncbi:MAG: hypothetical protein AAFP89_11865 [Bacteroidota bacterium]
MNIFKRILLLILPLSLIFISCEREPSVNVDQDTVYGEYRLVYDANEDKTYARATFRFGSATGTILELSEPAEITYDGDQMPWKPILAYYEQDFAGKVASGTFSYTDLEQNTFENAVSLASEIGLSASLTEISQGAAFTLIWEGSPIVAGEIITVTINGINEGDAQIFIEADPGATSIVLPKDKLEELGIGTARVFIERRANAQVQQGTSRGGAIWSRYNVGPIDVEIVE